MLALGIVAARLNYGNSLMCGMSNQNFNRLQVTQNALARAVCSAPGSTSATELRRSLVSSSLTSLFSTNLAISETKGQGWRAISTQ